MNDLISRQAAIDEAKEWIDAVYFEENDKRERKAIECFIGSLKNMPSAQPEQMWIPCSERLPKPNSHNELNVDIYYLAQTEFGDMIVASYNESHDGATWWEQMYSYRIFDDEIVAWMPLPEPWKEKPNEIH